MAHANTPPSNALEQTRSSMIDAWIRSELAELRPLMTENKRLLEECLASVREIDVERHAALIDSVPPSPCAATDHFCAVEEWLHECKEAERGRPSKDSTVTEELRKSFSREDLYACARQLSARRHREATNIRMGIGQASGNEEALLRLWARCRRWAAGEEPTIVTSAPGEEDRSTWIGPERCKHSPMQTGRVSVTSTPETSLSVDGRPLGRTPLTRRLPAGCLLLRAVTDDGREKLMKVTIKANMSSRFKLTL